MTAAQGPTPYSAGNNTSPAMGFATIASSDTVNNPIMFRAIYVGGGGDISILGPSGNAATFVAVPQGTILPVMCVRVNQTGTTASSMIGLS